MDSFTSFVGWYSCVNQRGANTQGNEMNTEFCKTLKLTH